MPINMSSWGASNNAQMEQELSSLANRLYEQVLDLNVSPQSVSALMDQTTTLRNKLLSWYGIDVGPAKGKGKSGVKQPTWEATASWAKGESFKGGKGGKGDKGGGKGKSKGAPQAKKPTPALTCGPGEALMDDWKSTLVRAIASKRGGSVPKDVIMVEYSETPMMVSGVEKKGFTAVVFGEDLVRTHHGDPCKSKKEAEQDACRKAVQGEFRGQQPVQVTVSVSSGGLEAPTAGVKRSAAGAGLGQTSNPDTDKKGRIAHLLRVLLGRPVTASETVYQTTESLGSFTCTLTLPTYQDDAIFQGEPCPTQKAAEQSAAAQAVAAFEEIAGPAEAEAKIRRVSRRAEKDAAFQARLNAKKNSPEWVP